jgi:hypothetical protein
VHSGPPPSALVVPRGNHSAAWNPDKESNQGTPRRVQVPQVDPPMIGLHNKNQEQSRKNRTGRVRGKQIEEDIKLKHNLINIITYRAR